MIMTFIQVTIVYNRGHIKSSHIKKDIITKSAIFRQDNIIDILVLWPFKFAQKQQTKQR